MKTIIPGEVATKDLHQYLMGSVAPRPICFASTLDENGTPNLSPFSFFNVFGTTPATLVFSPSRRVRDNTTKHTLQNVEINKEVVINVVNYDMVQQQSLASCEYPDGVNEFEKAGFTMVASDLVKPFRVKESPVQMECKVVDIIYTGNEGGAGNLVVCQVLKMHINEAILNEQGAIDPNKIRLVARMGGDWYCKAFGDGIFEVPKPNTQLGIGFDQLPAYIRNSSVLSGNDLGILANYTAIPELEENFFDPELVDVQNHAPSLHGYAKRLIAEGKVDHAWQVLLREKE